ncbi:MAG: hypothetical protein K2J08_02235 [Ruminococcus sp.]|nr:hypothetical protein [Ruminococcus sp.]
MFADIFQVIMFILLGIGFIVLTIVTKNGWKIGKYKLYDGIVTSVNPNTRNIDVAYTVGETSYLFSYNMLEFQDMPEVGLKVRVLTYVGNHQKVFTVHFQREMGRGKNHKYIDNDSSTNRIDLILCSILLILLGIVALLDGLNII